MSVQHRKDSIRGMRLERLGIQPPSDWNNVEQVRAVKKQEIGAECSAAIYAGVDVGGSHYSLTEHDQTELLAQAQAVKEGAAAVPYHADGELCRMYPAEEFTALAQAATAHVFYHRTYCNHVNAWIARADLAELDSIKYGAELPADLAKSMAAIIAAAGGGRQGVKRVLTIWAILGAAYVALETVFRGYSHPSMLIVGGLCGVLVGEINQRPGFFRAPVIVQAVIGALIVLAVEFVSGCILNLWLGLGVWDYSNQPGNVLGQICPAFGLLWFFIMPFAIWAEDTTRWTIWNYECLVYGWTESPPEVAPYSLKSIYREFFHGR